VTSYPRPNWWLFNRLSLMPATGVVLLVGGIIRGSAWLLVLGVVAAVLGTWLTMRRLTGRVSERSLLWVLLDTAILGAGIAVAFALHLSGLAFLVVILVPGLASESIATAFTGVKEAG
jgi:uncharacterized membrane protein HdeD (DUF308 family)